jgi:plasmid stabilization system protein ParE
VKRYRVVFSEIAEQELDDLADFITQTSGALRANRFIETIVVDSFSLATLPHRGSLRPKLGKNVRKIGVAKNRATLTFHVGDDEVLILSVRYAGWPQ